MKKTEKTDRKTQRARADLVRAAFGPGARVETSTTGCTCCAQGVQIRRGDACLGAGRTFDEAFDQAAGRALRIGGRTEPHSHTCRCGDVVDHGPGLCTIPLLIDHCPTCYEGGVR